MEKSISLNLGRNRVKLAFSLINSRISAILYRFLDDVFKGLLKVINIGNSELCKTQVQLELVKNSTIKFIHGKKYSLRE